MSCLLMLNINNNRDRVKQMFTSVISNDCSIMIKRGERLIAPIFINVGNDNFPRRLNFKHFQGMEIYFHIINKDVLNPCQLFVKKLDTLNNINEYGDIILNIEPEDTHKIEFGTYAYTLTGAMYDEILDKVWMYTLVGPKDFKIIK